MIVGYLMKPQGLQGEFKQCMCSNRGGYKLNTVDIKALKISDLINTSTIDSLTGIRTATVTCSAEGGTGSYTYEVYVEGDGYNAGGQEITVSDNTAVIILQSGYYKIWVIVTDTAGVKATKYFAFVGI